MGSLKANPFGLHDAHGNVVEWCLDGYAPYDEREAREGDGLRMHWQSSRDRVFRGGSFLYDARFVRSAYRGRAGPGSLDFLGFRPALSVTTF
ncbi:MAG: hypothetical protein CMJ83_12245 [Planctomycetes bacterium]|nr:hypothetical protein [Planctomycetota bacterium]